MGTLQAGILCHVGCDGCPCVAHRYLPQADLLQCTWALQTAAAHAWMIPSTLQELCAEIHLDISELQAIQVSISLQVPQHLDV